MQRGQVKIILKYKNEQKEMIYIPRNYKDLKDYFLSVFNEKSSKKIIFYFQREDNQKIIIQDFNYNNIMREISQQNSPIIYISEENDSSLQMHSQNDNNIYEHENNIFNSAISGYNEDNN